MAIIHRRRRRAVDRVDTRARRFWSWWAGAQDGVAAASDAGDGQRVRQLVEPRARTYHRDLSWHVGPGTHARRMLVLTGARHPALRGIAERWRLAGPADDAEWEFHAALPPEPSAFSGPVQVGDRRIDPGAATALATADDRRYRLDLVVHHPAFVGLEDAARERVAAVLVGWALGEDETDRWIGRIATSGQPALDAVPVSMLGEITVQLATRWGGERWATLEGAFDDRRLIARVRHPLHRVDHPLFDEHIAVRLPYTDALPDGLPAESAVAELEAFEEALLARLRSDALLVARQTTSGERLLHFYANSASRRAYAIRGMLLRYAGPIGSVQAEYDPGWQHIDHLRV